MSRPEVNASAGNLSRLIAEATSLHQQGHLAEAEGLLQAALREDAGNFDALHRIGTIRVEEGRHEEAVGVPGVDRAAPLVDDHDPPEGPGERHRVEPAVEALLQALRGKAAGRQGGTDQQEQAEQAEHR